MGIDSPKIANTVKKRSLGWQRLSNLKWLGGGSVAQNRRSSETQGTALAKCLQAWPVYIYRSMPGGVAQSRHAFVGGTVSTWSRCRIPVNKGRKGIRNANQALTVRREHADRIIGSPSWESSINYKRFLHEDLKLLQIGSSQLPPPFRGLHSPGVRKHCQIIFACYFRKLSVSDSRGFTSLHCCSRAVNQQIESVLNILLF